MILLKVNTDGVFGEKTNNQCPLVLQGRPDTVLKLLYGELVLCFANPIEL